MPTKTYLAFDYGTLRIGVAVGNSLTETASPVQTVGNVNGTPDWAAIEQLILQFAALSRQMPVYAMVGTKEFFSGRLFPAPAIVP